MKISQCGKRFHVDALIIGSGVAGLCYALRLATLSPNSSIALLSKSELAASNSAQAQGGIAAAQDSKDIDLHITDTINASDQLAIKDIVRIIVEDSPAAIEQLIEYGVAFDKNKQGDFDLTQEGGHSRRRIYHHDDASGSEIVRALLNKVRNTPQIHCYEYHTAINLITQDANHTPGSQAEVFGAYVLDEQQSLIHTFLSKVTCLACGGAGKVYRYTSNSDIATGDGIAMAHRAGARVKHMEFYQFHPTLLYHPDSHNFLISESLRGEGAYLRSPDTSTRFMKNYAPEQMELATRDIVTRAVFNEIESSGFNNVYLDIRHHDKHYFLKRFPHIYHTLFELGIDMSKDLIPVVPAAHYLCGGILSDSRGKTDLTRLFAVGENACTGMHGANRLASNSLLECVVVAENAAKAAIPFLEKSFDIPSDISDWNSQSVINLRRASQINAHWRGLRGEMSSYAGIVRTEDGLKDLLRLIRLRADMIESYYWQHTITRDLIELRNIVLITELITIAAIERTESCGGHYREDSSSSSHYEERSFAAIQKTPPRHCEEHSDVAIQK